jgi:hypothetical protein
MRSKDANEDALDEFVHYWGKLGKFPLRGEEIEIVKAIVTYTCRGNSKTIKARMHLFHNGRRVELIPSGWLNTDDYYTGFDPTYQKFVIQAGHVLRIQGEGSKVGGAYSVDILPE